MPTFPRTKQPRAPRRLKGRMPLASVSQRGVQQVRATTARGFAWRETWAALAAGDPDVEALCAFIVTHARLGTLIDVEHVTTPGSGKDPNGLGTAGVTVSGAGQTGSSLVTAGWPMSTALVVRAGDVIKLAGLNAVFMITADAASDASGLATLPIDPPIVAGGSPADGAAVTTTGVLFRARIAGYDMPDVPPGDVFTGMTVDFLEAP